MRGVHWAGENVTGGLHLIHPGVRIHNEILGMQTLRKSVLNLVNDIDNQV